MKYRHAMLVSTALVLALAGCAPKSACTASDATPIRGPFPLLCTPWTAEGALDCDVLAKEAAFMSKCGVAGVIWPTAGEVVDLVKEGEYVKGLEALAARAAQPDFTARLTAICSGTTSARALNRVREVNAVMDKYGVKMAILARPPDDAKTQADIEAHYRALAKIAKCPVIIQTYNGKSPQPSVELLVRWAKGFPENLGYVKEEAPGLQVNGRMEQLVADPAIKTVFSGWGGKGWIYQATQIGTKGVISQRPAYAPLFVKIWQRAKAGADASDPALVDAYTKYLYMANLGDIFSTWEDDEMRGPHLYVLERLGIFRNRLSRTGKGKVEDFEVSEKMKAEFDARIKVVFGF